MIAWKNSAGQYNMASSRVEFVLEELLSVRATGDLQWQARSQAHA